MEMAGIQANNNPYYQYLQNISEYLLQYLERLEIETFTDLSSIRGYTLDFPNVKSLKLTPMFGVKLSCPSFDKPEEFIIESSNHSIAMDHELGDFIGKHESLTKLIYR